eukprot:10500588-Karenia_brevis.AAC.1
MNDGSNSSAVPLAAQDTERLLAALQAIQQQALNPAGTPMEDDTGALLQAVMHAEQQMAAGQAAAQRCASPQDPTSEATKRTDVWASGNDPWQQERPPKAPNTGIGKGPAGQQAPTGEPVSLPQSAVKGSCPPKGPIGPISTAPHGPHPASDGVNDAKPDPQTQPVL